MVELGPKDWNGLAILYPELHLSGDGSLKLGDSLDRWLGTDVIVAAAIDVAVSVYRPRDWSDQTAAWQSMSSARYELRLLVEASISTATATVLTDGALSLPSKLRELARLGDTALPVRMHNRLELWSPDAWQSCHSRTAAKSRTHGAA